MKDAPQTYSKRAAKHTLIFVIILLSLVVILSCIAIYQMNRQSSVLVQSQTYNP
jgi:hypothetical protein